MLHFETLPVGTLDLLKNLSAHPVLQQFSLVGGTALALRFGHRRSIDFDFFTPDSFDVEALADTLSRELPQFATSGMNKDGFNASIGDLKVDFVTYRYPLLAQPETQDGIRMFSLPDIVGMKLSAITNRGARKDFYDLHALIQHLGVDALIDIYRQKYPRHDPMIALRSMIYFDDAEEDADPDLLISKSWEEVKEEIREAVKSCKALKS
jgi:predicted nucleotidyltransferase component of viral defense system